MKKHLALLLFLLAPAVLLAQEEDYDYEKYEKAYDEFMERYKSSEEEAYYHVDEDKEWVVAPIVPTDAEDVKSYKNKFFEFTEIENFTPYDENQQWTPFQDSLIKAGHFLWYEPRQFIGGVDRSDILKYEKKDNVVAFAYWQNEFRQGRGIWIAYSMDGGKSWAHYHSGLIQEKPLFVKWYSKYPLIKSNGDLQIEACLMRKASGPGLHGFVEHELVQDGLLVTFELETLAKDSDGDGLTDIMETRLRTDLNNLDTDGDGITDDLDMNPRYNLPRTEKTLIYEAVINDDLRAHRFWDEDCEIIPFSEMPIPHYVTDTTNTILVVTDDPDFLACQPTQERIIFMRTEEFENTKDTFFEEKENVSFSPLFKVDNMEDAYVFGVGGAFWSNDYVVEKQKDGWCIKVTMSIIE